MRRVLGTVLRIVVLAAIVATFTWICRVLVEPGPAPGPPLPVCDIDRC